MGPPAGRENRENNKDLFGAFGCFPVCGRMAVTTAI